ncbi:unnamed protein product [Rhizophagus irregularis]|uniref:DUF8211 domain-containing protein n=1 Tax=Rhizophagus irregularis TaxID=588596 RepID=A0A2I1HNI6_9GLOM|nr:hypothetical protein RhiirA4_484164 [Rhizophagus irregularis]CAB4419293.1 unnamed protein product [Rhizophagus irregularis]
MSLHQRACIDHHKQLEIFTNVKNTSKPAILPPSSSLKGQHATHLFNKSSMKTTKRVFSLQQGTKYKVHYAHYNRNVIENSRIRNMYYSHRFALRHTIHSPSSSKLTKQEIRFERNCRRTFNHDKNHPAMLGEINDQLACASRSRFLFLTTQDIYSPINHLQYKECNPKREDYSFPIPIHSTKILRGNPKSSDNAYYAMTSSSRSTNPRH